MFKTSYRTESRSHARLMAVVIAAAALPAFGGTPTIMNVNTSETYTSLQAAINAADPGQLIELGAGTLFESNITINESVAIRGQGMDATIIDAQNNNLVFNAGIASLGTLLEGFTITGGERFSGRPGGLYAQLGAQITIRNVRFADNEGFSGGAIGVDGGSFFLPTEVRIEGCEFIGNEAQAGGAIAINSVGELVHVYAINTLCADNHTSGRGAAASVSGVGRQLTITNCTFADNVSESDEEVLYASGGAEFLVENSVVVTEPGTNEIRANSGNSIIRHTLISPNTLLIGFNDLGGNITASPIFADEFAGDYRLSEGSPGIDAANQTFYALVTNLTSDLNGDPRFFDDPDTADTGTGSPAYLDMGAYEFQGVTVAPCPGDIDGSGGVDIDDLNALLSVWDSDVGVGDPRDLAGDDGLVNIDDLNVVLSHWNATCI